MIDEFQKTQKLEAVPSAGPGAVPESPSPQLSHARATVLVVDDDTTIRRVVEAYLAALGVDIRLAASGEEALEIFWRGGIDLVILDVVMPGLSGYEVCSRIKSDPRSAMVPVVMASGLSEREDRIKGLQAGASDFIVKPVDRAELQARVGNLLALHRTRQALEAARLEQSERAAAAQRAAFKRYMSPAVVDLLFSSGVEVERALDNQDHRLHGVVLFADLRGFTAMAENLAPLDVVALLNRFFASMTAIVHRHGGTVFNLAGDALMAGFGVPFAQADAAARSVLAARNMAAASKPLFARWPVEVGLGVGINLGEVVAGNIGSPDFMSYTLIGDTVNVASRLTAQAGAGEILISDAVRLEMATHGAVLPPLRQIPPMMLKGKSQPVRAWSLVVT